MSSGEANAVSLVWDLRDERLTVGGALVLRQEGEMIARLEGRESLALHIVCNESDRAAAHHLAQVVFGASAFPCQLIYSADSIDGWPHQSVRAQPDFSYFSFLRVIRLYGDSGVRPRLQWGTYHEAQARHARRNFSGKLICVHLRSVAPFSPEESNANGLDWKTFFAKHADPGACDFLLIGDDPLPAGMEVMPGVSRALDHGLGLASQLALVGFSDGFLGMASGLCTAANFSDVPYVIFKHPSHHAAEISLELGAGDALSFATKRQRLWRCEASSFTLDDAFQLITS